MARISLPPLLAALVLLAGCSQLGSLGNILGSMGGTGGSQQQQQQTQVDVEIQQVDVNNQVLHVRTQQGQNGTIRFDSQTQVIYRQQTYPVTALERGDVVRVQLQQISQNEVYASRIDVLQSAQERTGAR